MTRRSRIVGFGSAALLVVAGAACAAAFGGGVGEILALVMISLGFVEAVSLVFLEVGLSEDRARAREDAARTRDTVRKRPPAEELGRRRGGTRLDRMRGRPRRLR